MRKNLSSLLVTAALVFSFNLQTAAQNTSPYWSLAGNSNASSSSKLGTTNNVNLRLFTNNLERMRINSSNGYVGIGTTNPQQRFHVEGPSLLSIFVSTTALGNTSGSGMIGYTKHLPTNSGQRLGYFLLGSRGGAENNYHAAGMSGYAAGAWSAGSSYPAYLTFETTPAGSASRVERVRITQDGYVGVGTPSPINELHVVGRGRLTNGLSVDNGGIYSTYFSGNGVEGYGSTDFGMGVYGSGYFGVYGYTPGGGSQSGVYGYCGNFGHGTYGYCVNGSGAVGYSENYIGVYGQTGSSSSYAGYFVGDVYSTGSYLGSDRKLKQNISDVESAIDIINKLQPKVYEYKQEGNYKLMNLPKGKHYGLIAQELEQVLPSLVKESEFRPQTTQEPAKGVPGSVKIASSAAPPTEKVDFKAVNYTELIPILVKAVQEQQEQIEQLKETISKLTKDNAINPLASSTSLTQNSPNPAINSTSIQYSIPQDAKRAQLVVTDNLGRTIKVMQLTASGVVNLNTATLSSGVYNYSLVIDGKTIRTKKMTVAR